MNKKTNIRSCSYIALCAVLIAVCAWIRIPALVPFTMQTFGVMTALLLLGGKRGTAAVGVYLSLALIGLPVCAGFQGGFGVFTQPTGGYLWGFLLTGLIYWLITALSRQRLWGQILGMIFGILGCYTAGTMWLFVWQSQSQYGAVLAVGDILPLCVLPFVIPDLLKCVLAFFLARRLRKILPLD
ncbi:MAG: biotin transporter BioY [Ruminococcus sp.]|nr:biotin transporter BioY [Ruminococcus sp.]